MKIFKIMLLCVAMLAIGANFSEQLTNGFNTAVEKSSELASGLQERLDTMREEATTLSATSATEPSAPEEPGVAAE